MALRLYLKKKVLVMKSNRKVSEIAAQFCGLQKTSDLLCLRFRVFTAFDKFPRIFSWLLTRYNK